MTRFIALLALAAVAFAAPTQTPIQDTLYSVTDNALLEGTIRIELMVGGGVSNGSPVFGERTITITSGALSISLPPTSTMTPSGSYYRVTKSLRPVGSGERYRVSTVTWTVTPAASCAATTYCTVSEIESLTAPTPSGTVNIARLTGCSTDGHAPIWSVSSNSFVCSAAGATVLTTLGDIIYGGVAGAETRLAGNTTTTRKFLSQTGTGSVSAAPAWTALEAADLPTHNASTATALASNPTDCEANQYATAIDASGNLTCSQPAASSLSNGTTGSGAVVLATLPTLTGAVITPGTNPGSPSAGQVWTNSSDGRLYWYDGVNAATRAALYLPSGTGLLESSGTALTASGIPSTTVVKGAAALTTSGTIPITTSTTGMVTQDAALTFNATGKTLGVAQGTITSQSAAWSSTATWNNSGVTFTHLLANVTDTASAAASLLMDLQVGGTSKFKVGKSGTIITGTLAVGASNTSATQTLSTLDRTAVTGATIAYFGYDGTNHSATSTSVIIRTGSSQSTVIPFMLQNTSGTNLFGVDGSANTVLTNNGGTGAAQINSAALRMGSTQLVGWASGSGVSTATDTAFARNGAGIVEVNNGTAGAYRDIITRSVISAATSAATLANSQCTFHLASNTQLTFTCKGSDGTLRTNTLTLI